MLEEDYGVSGGGDEKCVIWGGGGVYWFCG